MQQLQAINQMVVVSMELNNWVIDSTHSDIPSRHLPSSQHPTRSLYAPMVIAPNASISAGYALFGGYKYDMNFLMFFRHTF
ncbi:MAG: hypothetical protein WAZ77_21810 [Candidatus Nitrosopolaris sp.]